MQLRPHETDKRLTVVTYDNENEAFQTADELAPLSKRIFIYLGLIDGINIHQNKSFSMLDNGQVEITHPTSRLARYAGRIAKKSSQLLDTDSTFIGYKLDQDRANTINNYISTRLNEIPIYEVPKPTTTEKARSNAFSTLEQPYKLAAASIIGFLTGVAAGVGGRLVGAASHYHEAPNHVNETLIQVGNDMSYSGLALAGLSAVVGFGIARGYIRNKEGFNSGWDAASLRLDPDGLIESTLSENVQQTEQ